MSNKYFIPIFPLSGVILFPQTNLPLNIFEERYIDMIDYSLKNEKKVGMMQPKNKGELYSLGCIGKITSFEETQDGRYLINLSGEEFFTIKNEIESKYKFRIVEVKLSNLDNYEDGGAIKKIDKGKLLKEYQQYVNKTDLNIDIALIDKIDTVSLVKFIAMTSPFSVADKQMLLETTNIKELSKKLITLFSFYSSSKQQKNLIN